jgi:hypothetical protein
VIPLFVKSCVVTAPDEETDPVESKVVTTAFAASRPAEVDRLAVTINPLVECEPEVRITDDDKLAADASDVTTWLVTVRSPDTSALPVDTTADTVTVEAVTDP